MVEGGRTPILDAATLQKLGYRLAIFPALGFLAAGAVLEKAYAGLKATGSSVGIDVPLYPFKDFSALMGFDWVASSIGSTVTLSRTTVPTAGGRRSD